MTLHEELLQIYEEVDAALAENHYNCIACGHCCDFVAHDYILYASNIEQELAAEHMEKDPELSDGYCCFLNERGQCTAHEWRPLACRCYFCRRSGRKSHPARYEDFYEQALTKIKALANKYGRDWNYGYFFRNQEEVKKGQQ